MHNETIEKLVERFVESPGRMDMGAGKMSKRYGCTKDEARIARAEARDILRLKGKTTTKRAKVLLFDIETTPLKAYVWRTFKQNIYLDQMLTDTHYMLTWSAKWLGDDIVMSDRLTGTEVLTENDSRIVGALWELIDEADIVIAHFGDKFDIPMFNARCAVNGIQPPSPYRTIDTKQVSAKNFRFASNKLDGIAKIFGFKRKLDTDFQLWADCMKGDDSALERMEEYNVHDVVLLEMVYLKLRPWIKSHPNLALYGEYEGIACPNCGSENVEPDGFYYTNISKFQSYRCADCGSSCGHARKAIKRVPLTPNAR